MSRRIIVDGYNVIRRDPGLRTMEGHGLINAREALITKLQNSRVFKNDSITIVFDGWDSGNKFESVERLGRITIIYSRHGKKADEVIKELARSDGRASEILVITNDLEIRESVVASGGNVAAFAKEPVKTKNRNDEDNEIVSRTDKKGNPKKLPKRKRGGTTPDLH